VRQLSVLREALPVVAGRDHQQALRTPVLANPGEQPAELGVREGDLARVAVAREGAGKARGRIVRGVRIVEVDPEEETRGGRSSPGERRVHHAIRASLRVAHRAGDPILHPVVVGLEASGEAEAPVEHQRADDGRRGVSGVAHALRESRDPLVEAMDRVVAHAVGRRVEPRHQGGVSRKRQRRRGDGRGEANPRRGERVQVRGMGARRAVAADVVGPQGVDRDQEHTIRRGAGRRGAASGKQCD
jgi:hypothetical protein